MQALLAEFYLLCKNSIGIPIGCIWTHPLLIQADPICFTLAELTNAVPSAI